MDIQEKTNQMIDEAIAKGLAQLVIFKEAYSQFPEERRKDMTEAYIQKHRLDLAFWRVCVNCKETFPGGYPVVSMTWKGEVHFGSPEGFKAYFNRLLSIRTCPFCEQMHPTVKEMK